MLRAASLMNIRASLVAQRLKRLPPMRETWVRSLGQEDPLEKEMAIHSSILAWRIPWTEEPGGLQSTGSQRVGHNWATSPSPSLSLMNIAHLIEIDMPQDLMANVFFPSLGMLKIPDSIIHQWKSLSLHYNSLDLSAIKTWLLHFYCYMLDTTCQK